MPPHTLGPVKGPHPQIHSDIADAVHEMFHLDVFVVSYKMVLITEIANIIEWNYLLTREFCVRLKYMKFPMFVSF